MQTTNPLFSTEHEVTVKVDPTIWLFMLILGAALILLHKLVPST